MTKEIKFIVEKDGIQKELRMRYQPNTLINPHSFDLATWEDMKAQLLGRSILEALREIGWEV